MTGAEMRIGIGYDAHNLVEGRDLVLGGVVIDYPRGLAGHSDADVLTHALIDALLGAAGLGDIGEHFPDTDPAWEGVSSIELLATVMLKVAEAGWRVVNADLIVVLEEPKLAPYRSQISRRLARVLGVSPGDVSVKAKTNEGMGFIGRGEGVAATAVCLLTAGDSNDAGR